MTDYKAGFPIKAFGNDRNLVLILPGYSFAFAGMSLFLRGGLKEKAKTRS